MEFSLWRDEGNLAIRCNLVQLLSTSGRRNSDSPSVRVGDRAAAGIVDDVTPITCTGASSAHGYVGPTALDTVLRSADTSVL